MWVSAIAFKNTYTNIILPFPVCLFCEKIIKECKQKHTGVINRCVMNSYDAANHLFIALLIGALTETCSRDLQIANLTLSQLS